MNFIPRIQQAAVETFTTTFRGPEFRDLYKKLTHEKPATGALLSLTDSNWGVTISIQRQPVSSSPT
jgi:oleate hydratase